MKNRSIITTLILTILSITILYASESITVNATQGEITYPIWIDKGKEINFSVLGSWSMWDKWGPVDYNGHTSFQKINEYHLGVLVGRIEGGTNFPVRNNMTYTSPVSGRLILYPNRGNYAHLIASGSMTVTVEGARRINQDDAEKLHGWDTAKLDTAVNANFFTRDEKEVILLMNKARTNPSLFAKQYLESRKNEGTYARECYVELLSMKPVVPLLPSRALYLSAKDHAIDMGRTGNTGHNGTDGSSMSARINRYGSWGGGISENCSYGYSDPLGIVLQLLIDDGVPSRGHRKNILNGNSRFVGLSIQSHTRYRYNCVQDFAVDIKEK